jgi:serine/threonine protein kinase
MPSERIQRQIDALLDESDAAIKASDWARVSDRAKNVLALDPENEDAHHYLISAERALGQSPSSLDRGSPLQADSIPVTVPTSFCKGRYQVKKFLGEGGKKRVFLATDTLLDRDVAFALIKTDGLDEVGRERVRREAQAMGRLGAHPHVVSVFDLGEEDGQPFIVTELMGGGDVEGLIEKAESHRVPLQDAIRIADEVCQGLEFAHAKSVVHRDLKPGNVWLTADGTAKLGDFGSRRLAGPDAPHPGGNDGRDGELHAAGAGDRGRRDAALGPVLAGRHALRAGHRPPSVYWR